MISHPVLKLSSDMTHQMAVNTVSMTCSWHNITPEYDNNEIKYNSGGGKNWETIVFISEMYSCTDINDYIHQYMDKKGHKKADGTYKKD